MLVKNPSESKNLSKIFKNLNNIQNDPSIENAFKTQPKSSLSDKADILNSQYTASASSLSGDEFSSLVNADDYTDDEDDDELMSSDSDDDLGGVYGRNVHSEFGLPMARIPSKESSIDLSRKIGIRSSNWKRKEVKKDQEQSLKYLEQAEKPRDYVESSWNRIPVIYEIIDFYSNQTNIQMCVTISLVLRDFITISESQLEQWTYSYLDLLHRFKLWTVSARIIRDSPIPKIRSLNQESTFIHTACYNCHGTRQKIIRSVSHIPNSPGPKIGEVSQNGWICDRCLKVTTICSLCRLLVKGLYVWSQGCSHGGHAACLEEWFKTETSCPAGCGYVCFLTV